MKLESSGVAHSKRIVTDDGNILCMVEQYANDKWGLTDADTDNRITRGIFTTPKAALKYVKERYSKGIPLVEA